MGEGLERYSQQTLEVSRKSQKCEGGMNKEVQDLSLKCLAIYVICVMVYISPGKQIIPSKMK